VNVVLRDGRLINVELHNEQLSIPPPRFRRCPVAQINAKAKVTHRDMQISRMEIQSTVLFYFLEASNSLDNDNHLTIQVLEQFEEAR